MPFVTTILALFDTSGSAGNSDRLRQTIRELHQTKLDLLGSLIIDHETYLDDLSELEVSNGKLADQIEKTWNYIGEHVLWIRSADPLWMDELSDLASGVGAVVRARSLDRTRKALPSRYAATTDHGPGSAVFGRLDSGNPNEIAGEDVSSLRDAQWFGGDASISPPRSRRFFMPQSLPPNGHCC